MLMKMLRLIEIGGVNSICDRDAQLHESAEADAEGQDHKGQKHLHV